MTDEIDEAPAARLAVLLNTSWEDGNQPGRSARSVAEDLTVFGVDIVASEWVYPPFRRGVAWPFPTLSVSDAAIVTTCKTLRRIDSPIPPELARRLLAITERLLGEDE